MAEQATRNAIELREKVIDKEYHSETKSMNEKYQTELCTSKSALENTRKERKTKEEERDEKVIKAVCTASLLEFKETQRILNHSEKEQQQRMLQYAMEKDKVESTSKDAAVLKTQSISKVLDSKAKAHELKVKAEQAFEVYHDKQRVLAEKEKSTAEEQTGLKHRQALENIQRRKEEATNRRMAAEQNAKLAVEKAAMLREKAFQASAALRLQSKNHSEQKSIAKLKQVEQETEHQRIQLQQKQESVKKQTELANAKAQTAIQHAAALKLKSEEALQKAQQHRQKLTQSA